MMLIENDKEMIIIWFFVEVQCLIEIGNCHLMVYFSVDVKIKDKT